MSSPFNAAVITGFDRVEGGRHNKEHLILLLILMQNIILSLFQRNTNDMKCNFAYYFILQHFAFHCFFGPDRRL